jgi:hypothetical protein
MKKFLSNYNYVILAAVIALAFEYVVIKQL